MRFPGLALQAEGCDVTLFYGEPGDENAGKLQVAWQDDLLDPRIKYVAGVVKPECDVIVFQRPLRMEMRSIITAIQAHGVAVVVEVDDDFQSIDPRSTAYADCDPHKRPDRNWRHLAACCELADHVIVSTPALARRYGGHGRVSVIPNYVPAWYLDVPKPVHDGPPIVGWTGSVGTHAADLGVVGSAVAELVRSDVCQFRNVGTGWRVAEQLGLDDRYTRFDPNDMKAPLPWWAMGWQDLPDYPAAMATFDVNLVPLQESQFNESKSALKGLEGASTASWSVASPTGPYSAVSGAICWTASKPQKWKGAIRAALEAYADLGREARGYIRGAGWTYEAQCGRWWDAYVCAADHRASVMMGV